MPCKNPVKTRPVPPVAAIKNCFPPTANAPSTASTTPGSASTAPSELHPICVKQWVKKRFCASSNTGTANTAQTNAVTAAPCLRGRCLLVRPCGVSGQHASTHSRVRPDTGSCHALHRALQKAPWHSLVMLTGVHDWHPIFTHASKRPRRSLPVPRHHHTPPTGRGV